MSLAYFLLARKLFDDEKALCALIIGVLFSVDLLTIKCFGIALRQSDRKHKQVHTQSENTLRYVCIYVYVPLIE